MKLALIAFLIGAVLLGVGKLGLARKPADNSLIHRTAKAPVQAPLTEGDSSAAPIYLKFENQLYTLYPRASYAIEGLIVSEHRSDSIFDLAHAANKDTLNSRDICTVWGQTLTVGAYRDVNFWSGDWTCNYEYSSIETASIFKTDEVSNTHVLAKDPHIRAQIAKLEVGDEYRMTGRLVDYEQAFGGRRNTSLVRTDTGDGACEILYVENVEILKSHNRMFVLILKLGYWTALLAALTIIALMLRPIFFNRKLSLFFCGILAGFSAVQQAQAKICDASSEYCGDWGGNTSSSTSSSSRGAKIRNNPATIPIAKGFGAELLYFDGSVDFSLVKGLGRIGAAISPSNNEETFFGPPGLEISSDLLTRKSGGHKFPNQKYTFSTAFGLYDNRGSGYKKIALNLGVMGKYNRISGLITPGGGLSGVAGPLTFAYSRYADQTVLTSMVYPALSPFEMRYNYNVETFSAGLYIDNLAVDYSILKVSSDSALVDSTVSVFTATLLFKKALLTFAQRTEKNPRPTYDYDTGLLKVVDSRVDYFAGFQYAIADPVLLGVFLNYYLVRDVAVGITIFF